MAEEQKLHDVLWSVCKQLPQDYRPWGTVERENPDEPGRWWGDCASGCRHYFVLADVGEQPLSYDWGVCTNQRSHRCGLLTFEHQGCPAFEYDEEEGARAEAEFEARRAEALKRRKATDG